MESINEIKEIDLRPEIMEFRNSKHCVLPKSEEEINLPLACPKNMLEVTEYFAKANPRKGKRIDFESTLIFRNMLRALVRQKLRNLYLSKEVKSILKIRDIFRKCIDEIEACNNPSHHSRVFNVFYRENIKEMPRDILSTWEFHLPHESVYKKINAFELPSILEKMLEGDYRATTHKKGVEDQFTNSMFLLYLDYFLFNAECGFDFVTRKVLQEAVINFQKYMGDKDTRLSELSLEGGYTTAITNLLARKHIGIQIDISNLFELFELLYKNNGTGFNFFDKMKPAVIEECKKVCYKWNVESASDCMLYSYSDYWEEEE